jgi:hypothetical protein
MATSMTACSDKSGDSSGKSDPKITSQNEETTNNFDFDAAVSSIKFYGKDIALPCTLAELGEGFTADSPLPFKENSITCNLKHNGVLIGEVGFEDAEFGDDVTGKKIFYLKILESGDVADNFSVQGITLKSTEQEAIDVFGPATKKEMTSDESSVVWKIDDEHFLTLTELLSAGGKKQIMISTSV